MYLLNTLYSLRMQSKVCGRRKKVFEFRNPFSHPKSGALGKKMSQDVSEAPPLEKLSRAEIELRRCLEQDTDAKLLKSKCGMYFAYIQMMSFFVVVVLFCITRSSRLLLRVATRHFSPRAPLCDNHMLLLLLQHTWMGDEGILNNAF